MPGRDTLAIRMECKNRSQDWRANAGISDAMRTERAGLGLLLTHASRESGFAQAQTPLDDLACHLPYRRGLEHHTAGLAKTMCSAVYMTGLSPEFAAENVGYFKASPQSRATTLGRRYATQNHLFDIEPTFELWRILIRSFIAVAAAKSPMTNFLPRRTDNQPAQLKTKRRSIEEMVD
jgi:hypothetical protein